MNLGEQAPWKDLLKAAAEKSGLRRDAGKDLRERFKQALEETLRERCNRDGYTHTHTHARLFTSVDVARQCR